VFRVIVALPVFAVRSTDVGRDTVYVVDGVPVRLIVDALPAEDVTRVTPPVAVRDPAALITTVPGVAPGAKVPKSRGVVDETDSVLTRTADELTVPEAVNCPKALGDAKRLEPERIPKIRRAYPTGPRHDPVLLMRFLSEMGSAGQEPGRS